MKEHNNKNSAYEQSSRIPSDGELYAVVYRDGRYTLGQRGGRPFLTVDGEEYFLSCHPYEPCLYITAENGAMTAVHNAFDPAVVLERFAEGGKVTSITGTEYDAKDFCRMVEYAAGAYDIRIDEAESIFRGRAKNDPPRSEKKKEKPALQTEVTPSGPDFIIKDDPAYAVIGEYPDIVVDYCLVENERLSDGCNAHRSALLRASRKLFIDEDGEVIFNFDVGKADAKQIDARELFAAGGDGKLTYRKAFLEPPYTNSYTAADFEKVNASLFPNGTESLEVYEWTDGWSEYFDEGREWWGTLCCTVYDKTLDRFVVIMASATD